MNELIKEALNGNEEAYTKLIQSMQGELYRFAKSRLNNEDDINDAIQEAMVKSYCNLRKLRKPEYFKTWIKRILINECNRIYKSRKYELNILNKCMEDRVRMEDDYSIENAEHEIDFENLLSKLKQSDEVIVVLHFKERYTISEIADLLKLNVETVKSRVKRVKLKIKSMLKEE